jgi:mercuric ion binding protein
LKSFIYAAVCAITLLAPGALAAAEQTVRIEVTGLFCASCPYIAAQAITAISSAKITDGFYDADRELAQFVVQFDDEVTTLQAIVQATDEYGYPAKIVEPAPEQS